MTGCYWCTVCYPQILFRKMKVFLVYCTPQTQHVIPELFYRETKKVAIATLFYLTTLNPGLFLLLPLLLPPPLLSTGFNGEGDGGSGGVDASVSNTIP